MMTSVDFDTNFIRLKSNTDQELTAQYRGWTIYTQVIRGKIWVHWKNPRDPSLRYGCPITEEGMDATIKHVRFLIDTSILLENRVEGRDSSEGNSDGSVS